LVDDTTSAGPLDGIKVLDLCRLLPGAFATGLLGEMGADVIKVEQPGIGDPMRVYEPRVGEASAFTWVTDRSKRSVALNLRDPRGVEAVRRLAEGADVVVESFRPGVADRLGVGYADLRAVNTALVYCSISGYGADGPLTSEAGHDINYVGRAGLLSVTGAAGRPAVPGVTIADLAGGSLMGLTGLLAALVRAQRSGQGDHVDISMTDGAFALQALMLAAYFVEGRDPGIETELLNGGYPCYNLYAGADGRYLTVGPLEEHFWKELCDAVERPDLLPTQFDRSAVPVWRELFAERSRDEWLEVFAGRDVCVGPLNTLSEAAADPQLQHREMVTEQEHATAGLFPQVGTPIKFRERHAAPRGAAQALGKSTAAVLGEAGYSREEVERLLDDGVAAGPSDSAVTRQGASTHKANDW
jgi:crotonobetainyl-CoA:carnitine CoA-transferase CaiB-like acyl-CoA transferase